MLYRHYFSTVQLEYSVRKVPADHEQVTLKWNTSADDYWTTRSTVSREAELIVSSKEDGLAAHTVTAA
jgi:hypothetical protein